MFPLIKSRYLDFITEKHPISHIVHSLSQFKIRICFCVCLGEGRGEFHKPQITNTNKQKTGTYLQTIELSKMFLNIYVVMGMGEEPQRAAVLYIFTFYNSGDQTYQSPTKHSIIPSPWHPSEISLLVLPCKMTMPHKTVELIGEKACMMEHEDMTMTKGIKSKWFSFSLILYPLHRYKEISYSVLK